MALIQCPECNGQLSTAAESCPHCGMANPKTAGQPVQPAMQGPVTASIGAILPAKIIGGMLVFAITAWALSDDGPLSIAGSQYAINKKEKCKIDLQCWADKQIFSAGVYCQDDIQKLSKYSARWTDTGTFDNRFSRYRWINKVHGTVTFVGDKIEFQNGFGAYQPYIYECDFDPSSNKVLDVRARPGRLWPGHSVIRLRWLGLQPIRSASSLADR
jgi:hypothetical protein